MKETFFFDKRYERGHVWYERCFPSAPRGRICVEVAPSLFHKPEPPERVARCLPDARAICILRDPVERAVSHYFHYRGAGEPDVPFAAMAASRPDILEAGMYHRHLARWMAVLGREKVLVLDHEHLRNDPAAFCGRLCEALDLPERAPPPGIERGSANAATVPRFAPMARLMFRTAAGLRRAGADRVVNALRSGRLKRLAYGSGVSSAERTRVASQAAAFRPMFRDEVCRLEDLLSCDLGRWK